MPNPKRFDFSAAVAKAFASPAAALETECSDCGKPITVSGEAVALGRFWNCVLKARGERLIQADELSRCPDCGRRFQLKHSGR